MNKSLALLSKRGELKTILTTEEHSILEQVILIAIDVDLEVEEEGGYNLVDEVVDTSISDVLSYEGEKSDSTFDVATNFLEEWGSEVMTATAIFIGLVSSSSSLSSLVASSSLSSSTSSLSNYIITITSKQFQNWKEEKIQISIQDIKES